MVTLDPTVFKAYFTREFSYGATVPAVTDDDIQRAIDEAGDVFNPGLYPDDSTTLRALEYLSAHFLQDNLDSAGAQGDPQQIKNSHSVGSVSESMSVPPWMLEGAYALFATTSYGRKFLLLSKPYLDGAVFAVGGGTQF